MTEDEWKQIYGGRWSQVRADEEGNRYDNGWNPDSSLTYEEEQKQQQEQKRQEEEKKKKEEEEKKKNDWLGNGLKWLGDTAKGVGAGIQQGAGKLASAVVDTGEAAALASNQIVNAFDQDTNAKAGKAIMDSAEGARKWIRDQKDITGKNIEDTTKAKEAGDRIGQGKGDARDWATITGDALDAASTATGFLNPTRLAVDGAELTGKALAGQVAKEVAAQGGANAAQGFLQEYGKTGDINKAWQKAGEQAATGAIFQGGLEGLGYGIGKLRGKNVEDANLRNADDAVEGPTNAKTGEDGLDINSDAKAAETGSRELTEGASTQPESRYAGLGNEELNKASALDPQNKEINAELYRRQSEELKAQREAESLNRERNPLDGMVDEPKSPEEIAKLNQDLKPGETPKGLTEQEKMAYEADPEFRKQVDEKLAEAKKDFENNGLPNDSKNAQEYLDNIDSGKTDGLPDHVFREREGVESIGQILGDEQMPKDVRNAAVQAADMGREIDAKLENLMNDNTYNQAHAQMDAAYKERLAAVNEMPGPRQEIERQRLDEQYTRDLQELEETRARDLPQVQELNAMKQRVDERAQEIVADTNELIHSDPKAFRQVDETKLAEHRQLAEQNLAEAKKYDGKTTYALQEVSKAQNPEELKIALERNGETLKKELANQLDVKDIEHAKESISKISDTQMALARVTSPSVLFDKGGLNTESAGLFSELVNGTGRAAVEGEEIAKRLGDIKKALGSDGKKPEVLDNIVDYLEGKVEHLNVPGHEKAAKEIRGILDEVKPWLKENGYGTVSEFYFPHMRENDPKGLANLFDENQLAKGELGIGSLKSRKKGGEEYSKDVWNVLSTYFDGINRAKNIEPSLRKIESVSTQLKLASAEHKNFEAYAGFLDNYINQIKGKNQSNIEKAFDSQFGHNAFKKSTGAIRAVNAMATLGLSPLTALRQMTQEIATVGNLNPKWAGVGMVNGARMLASKEGRKELKLSGVLDEGTGLKDLKGLTQSRAGKAFDKVSDGLMSMVSTMDNIMRTQAYAGAKAKGLKLNGAKWERWANEAGLTGQAAQDFVQKKAMEYGTKATVDTQFITSKVDAPAAFNGPGMRTLTQLATFDGKQAGFLIRMGLKPIKDVKNGNYRLAANDMGKLIAMGATAWGVQATLGQFIGMKEADHIPFYDQAQAWFNIEGKSDKDRKNEEKNRVRRSPFVTMLFGDGGKNPGLVGALSKQDKGEGLKEFWDKNWQLIVPAGTQAKRTTEGIKSVEEGVVKNDKGNTRFIQNQDQGNALKAAILGKYTTENGQKWLKEGSFSAVKESQQQKIESLESSKAREQATEYFQRTNKIPSRKEAYDNAKQALQEGNRNRAQSIINEYNSKVKGAYDGFELTSEQQKAAAQREIQLNRVVKSSKQKHKQKSGW
nr:MAG TPA: MAEBL protein [Caudoviricetes sp.]